MKTLVLCDACGANVANGHEAGCVYDQKGYVAKDIRVRFHNAMWMGNR